MTVLIYLSNNGSLVDVILTENQFSGEIDFIGLRNATQVKIDRDIVCNNDIYCNKIDGHYSSTRSKEICTGELDCICTCMCTGPNNITIQSPLCNSSFTFSPTISPTLMTSIPTSTPTRTPTKSTGSPTQSTSIPTQTPTNPPSETPTLAPTSNTSSPTLPTLIPTKSTVNPTSPTLTPTELPTDSPSVVPTDLPSAGPTLSPNANARKSGGFPNPFMKGADQSVLAGIIIIVIFLLILITIIAYIHTHSTLCPCFAATDDARVGALVLEVGADVGVSDGGLVGV